MEARGPAAESGPARRTAPLHSAAISISCATSATSRRFKDRSAEIVDARAADGFAGKAPDHARASLGPQPGSHNLPFAKLLNKDGTLKTAPEIERFFEEAGVDLSKPVVASCGSGITASVLALGLAEIGHPGQLV